MGRCRSADKYQGKSSQRKLEFKHHSEAVVMGVPRNPQEKLDRSSFFLDSIRALETILAPGQVTELRALDVSTSSYRRPHVVSGYFDNVEAIAKASVANPSAKGVYFTLNPINHALLARAINHLRDVDKHPLTTDTDVLSRRWLPIDVDAVRPSGISSSEGEHEDALTRARDIRDSLREEGWPEPILGDSGNGGHVLYRIELESDDNGLVQQVLEVLASQFSTPRVVIDRTVFNPARIWKLYGTVARKGDNAPDRPHRISRILEIPDKVLVVRKELLEKFVAFHRLSKVHRRGQIKSERGVFNLDRWIAEGGLVVDGPEPWRSGRRWVFPVCPWNPNHRNRSAYIVQTSSGDISAGCHHASCSSRDWKQLRHLYDHGSQDRKSSQNSYAVGFAGGTVDEATPQTYEGDKPEINIPGEHDGLRFGHDQTVAAMIPHLPLGVTLFRRGGKLVQLAEERAQLRLHQVSPDDLRSVVDKYVDLTATKTYRGQSVREYRPCSGDLAGVLLAALSGHPGVPECETISSFPTWLRSSSGIWHLPHPGYDRDACHFFDAPPEMLNFSPMNLDPANPRDQKIVHAIASGDEPGPFQHFPWKNRGSMVNALAALFSILMRPGIRSPVPIIAVTAPLPRTGKGLLVNTIHKIATGRDVCIHLLSQNEEEISKVLLASLRGGTEVILFDNVRSGRSLHSETLAAFITSSDYGGRLLGHSIDVSYPNRTVLFLTGNNLSLSKELALRTLAVELRPTSANPEFRTGLPNLGELIDRNREWLLSLFHGMIQAWVRMGAPSGNMAGLAGFEEWGAAVGGVLGVSGFAEQLGSNLSGWRAEADTETSDECRFLLVWQQEGEKKRRGSARDLLALSKRAGLFSEVFACKEHGQATAFARSVLNPLIDVPREILNENGKRQRFEVVRIGSEKAHRVYQYRLDVS
jgi:hypothetical protein